jgi:hypothetical protein
MMRPFVTMPAELMPFMARPATGRHGRSPPGLVEPGDQPCERGDVAVVPAGQPLGQAIPDGLRGSRQMLLPGGGKGGHAAVIVIA